MIAWFDAMFTPQQVGVGAAVVERWSRVACFGKQSARSRGLSNALRSVRLSGIETTARDLQGMREEAE
jgi:hypothetical protein